MCWLNLLQRFSFPMPLIDYPALRATVSMERVLLLVNFQARKRRGDQVRGPCPIHDPDGQTDPRCFSAQLNRKLFRCFECGASGNVLDLWRLTYRLRLHDAAFDMCRRLQITPPWLPELTDGLSKTRNSNYPSTRPATD